MGRELECVAPMVHAAILSRTMVRGLFMLLLNTCANRWSLHLSKCLTEQHWNNNGQKARATAQYILRTYTEIPVKDVASLFEIDERLIRRNVTRIAEMRDRDRDLDQWIERVGHMVRGDVG